MKLAILQKISATWNLEIPEVEVPELPEGVTRDPVKRQQDWVEVANNLMVSCNVCLPRISRITQGTLLSMPSGKRLLLILETDQKCHCHAKPKAEDKRN